MCFVAAQKGPTILNHCLKHLRLPVLKRLAKDFGERMNQSRELLQEKCFNRFAHRFPEVLQKIKHFEEFTEINQYFNLDPIELNKFRELHHKRIVNRYLLTIRNIGIENLEPNINHYSVFCEWFRRHPVSIHSHFHMETGMFPLPIIHTPVVHSQVEKKFKISFVENQEILKNETCSICLETTSYIKTNCNHQFCNCILYNIVKNNLKCPMCREEIKSIEYNNLEIYQSTSKIINCITELNVEII